MAESETRYEPPSGFEEDKKDPLIELDLSDSTELWLIQWPINQTADFDAKEVTLKLDGDGHLGTFSGTCGKSYEMLSCRLEGPSPMVFLTSPSEAKIAGKISRRVSLIHYPEPSELQARNNLNLGPNQRSSGATSMMAGRRLPAPTRSVKPRNHPSPRKHATKRSAENSLTGSSGVDSIDRSQERKSKKQRKN